MDMVWGYLGQRFPLLSEIALAILVVPHSNAADEMVFSMVRKNKTGFRSRLDLLNFSFAESCYGSKDEITRADPALLPFEF